MPNLAAAVLMLLSLLMTDALHAEEAPELNQDPHFNALGFFDMHLCNWPQRPNYFKILFNTDKYQFIDSMSVYTPDDKLLATLDKTKFKSVRQKYRPEKRIYLLDIDVPEFATSGWYRIDVKATNGKSYQAKDYVVMSRLERASEMTPSGEDVVVRAPVVLRWKSVPGAGYYRVFIRDAWSDDLVYESGSIEKNAIRVPDNILEAGGYYYWSIHSSDVNGNILLGDFHMGSMSEKAFFNIAE